MVSSRCKSGRFAPSHNHGPGASGHRPHSTASTETDDSPYPVNCAYTSYVSTVTIVTGLPGSGKTWLLRRTSPLVPGAYVADDYHRSSHGPHPRQSPLFESLVEAASCGRAVLASDIRYCDTDELENFREAVSAEVPGVAWINIQFENNLIQCLSNIARRGRPTAYTEALRARELSMRYRPSDDALPVHRGLATDRLLDAHASLLAGIINGYPRHQ